MTDTMIKGTAPDISTRMWEELCRSFPLHDCIYKDGSDLPMLAKAAGQQEVIEWIKNRAKLQRP